MKKLLILVLSLCMVLALVACGGQTNEPAGSDQDNPSPVVSDPVNESKQTDAPGEAETNTPEEAEGGKVLVAYFSCTNNTKGVAEKIAAVLDADLYEIVPEVAYTSDDLDYNTDCRANREQNDDTARPAISGSMENMTDYDTIFLGYPIWWGQAPKIMYTFVESYDLSGKTIVPFCTSGSSPIGSSATNLHSSVPTANWLDGARFSADASEATIQDWLDSLEVSG